MAAPAGEVRVPTPIGDDRWLLQQVEFNATTGAPAGAVATGGAFQDGLENDVVVLIEQYREQKGGAITGASTGAPASEGYDSCVAGSGAVSSDHLVTSELVSAALASSDSAPIFY